MSPPPDLHRLVRAWIAEDPDPRDRAELAALLDDPDPAAVQALEDRFRDRLHFGTAGLRGTVGGGPNRMNRAVVKATTAALAHWLLEHHPDSRGAGVVVGCDARHRSVDFAEEAVAVLTGAGIPAHLLPAHRPTPLLAFAVRHLGAAAGIMITASHNPPADNGYKLYLGDGAQIVPPVDEEIEAAIEAVGALSRIPLGGGALVSHPDRDAAVTSAYLTALVGPGPAPAGAAELRVVYTPLHGVAGELFLAALRRAGFPPPHVVAAQAAPDPDFPTVAFPNPEEPGALDLALAEARERGADLVIANDPDGDRLAAAVPDPSAAGGWRVLSGDTLGALLASYLLERSAGDPRPEARLVATTVVSATLLARIAGAAGVRYAETLTGFKWIVRAGDSNPGSRFLFGYEEALGYAVGDAVRDKDGIGAALALLALAAQTRREGRSLLERYDDLERRHGVHLTGSVSVPTDAPEALMRRLRESPPTRFGGGPVLDCRDLLTASGDLPAADVLSYLLPEARVVIRPSGTEPKLKAYLQVTEPVGEGDLAAARRLAGERMHGLRQALTLRLGEQG